MTLEQIHETKTVLQNGVFTLDALARKLKCSRPAAERRVAELERVLRGSKWKLKTTFIRTGKRGPLTKAYFVDR